MRVQQRSTQGKGSSLLQVAIIEIIQNMSYPGYWLTLWYSQLSYRNPLSLYCDHIACGSEHSQCEPVDLATISNFDITLWWWIMKNIWRQLILDIKTFKVRLKFVWISRLNIICTFTEAEFTSSHSSRFSVDKKPSKFHKSYIIHGQHYTWTSIIIYNFLHLLTPSNLCL